MKTLNQFEMEAMEQCLLEDPDMKRKEYLECYPKGSRRDQWIKTELMPWVQAGNVLPWPVIHLLQEESNKAFLIHLAKYWPNSVPVKEGILCSK